MVEKDPRANDYSITLARGIRVLEIFRPNLSEVTTSEVAELVGVSRAAARRLLLTLTTLGYLKQSKSSFRLTNKIWTIGQGILAWKDQWHHATAEVIELSSRMNEPFSISVREGLKIRFVARDQTRRIHSARLMVGDHLPAYCSAAGKVLLAALSTDEIDEIIEKEGPLIQRTSCTITDRNELLEELRRVRLQSWATAEDEMEVGTIGIAVPIFNEEGSVIAALAVGSQKARRSVEELKRDFLPVLQDAGDRISSEL